MTFQKMLAATLMAATLMILPTVASAQAAPPAGAVKPEDAAKFMGGWALGLETPQGNMTMNLTVKNDNGKVVGSITSDLAPEAQTITDITKAGENLVLKYSLDMQGQAIPTMITLTPDGDKMKVDFDFADGQFVMPGTATKK
jgi:hypothetical protein